MVLRFVGPKGLRETCNGACTYLSLSVCVFIYDENVCRGGMV